MYGNPIVMTTIFVDDSFVSPDGLPRRHCSRRPLAERTPISFAPMAALQEIGWETGSPAPPQFYEIWGWLWFSCGEIHQQNDTLGMYVNYCHHHQGDSNIVCWLMHRYVHLPNIQSLALL